MHERVVFIIKHYVFNFTTIYIHKNSRYIKLRTSKYVCVKTSCNHIKIKRMCYNFGSRDTHMKIITDIILGSSEGQNRKHSSMQIITFLGFLQNSLQTCLILPTTYTDFILYSYKQKILESVKFCVTVPHIFKNQS